MASYSDFNSVIRGCRKVVRWGAAKTMLLPAFREHCIEILCKSWFQQDKENIICATIAEM